MKYRSRIIGKAFILLPALFAACLAGCVLDHSTGTEPVPGTDAAFNITVPGMRTPSTRALDSGKEKELSEVDVVIFSNTDNTILEHHRLAATAIAPGTGGNDYLLTVSNIENTVNITAAVIANASAEVTGALEAVKSGGTYAGAAKADFLLALRVTSSSKWSTWSTGYWTIPMYGEATVTGSIYNGTAPVIDLKRMLAKVDVVNNVAPADPVSPIDGDFRLTAVHVINYNTGGVIAPAWDAATGELETPPAAGANLPSGFNPGTKAWRDGNELTYTLGAEQTSLTDEIYLFESDALSGNTPPTAPDGLRLVLEGYYTSGGVTRNYFYPTDFTYPRESSATEYMPVLRNTCYKFTVTEASGRGYDRLGEAAAAFGVMSNLKTSLLVQDESGIRHMVWNGEHFFGLAEKEISLQGGKGSAAELKCVTNYPEGWQIDTGNGTGGIEYVEGSGWLSVEKDISGGSDQSAILRVTATSSNMGTQGAIERKAYLYLKAGRLSLRLTITQEGRILDFARSHIVWDNANNRLTFATTTAETSSIPANVQGVFFKWGSLVAMSPVGAFSPTPITSGGTIIFDPTINGATYANWYVIPYMDSSYPAPFNDSDSTSDDFRDYNDGAGYNENEGRGDICRYISAQNGWVAGNWRMPTMEEYETLINEAVSIPSLDTAPYVWDVITVQDHGDNKYGWYLHDTGRWLGAAVTGGTGTKSIPAEGVFFFPAGGYRAEAYSRYGNPIYAGRGGWWWSSSSYGIGYASNPYVDANAAGRDNLYREHHSFAVRCIRE